jgi:hypothetical protein
MMRRAVCIALALAASADAHRLDQYLQASRLSIDVARVEVEIDLTPGIAVASKVFGWIHPNENAYAQQVLSSIVLKADGAPVALTLDDSSFPTFQEMSEGAGTIRLRASASIPPGTPGRHQLCFLNMHRPESSIYLVNMLVPSNPRLKLGEQRRDIAQHQLTLDYAVIADAEPDRTLALLLGCAMLGFVLLRHGRALRAIGAAPR